MPLSIKNWDIQSIFQMHTHGNLDLAPEYQRREAWTSKKKMALIDSIARRIPISAITVYKTKKSGALTYEVIDGKQRLTALMDYLSDKFTPAEDQLSDFNEEEDLEGKELAERILNKKWSELSENTKSDFVDYEMPVYIVDGERASAVRAFRRMNDDPYALKPQEIRNAVFSRSNFLAATHKLADEIDSMVGSGEHLLVEWGVISPRQWIRMQDHQFLSEILALNLAGPQEARRTLDEFYEKYTSSPGPKAKKLKGAVAQCSKAFRAIQEILGDSLEPHFSGENHTYAILGALFKRGIPTAPQLKDKNIVADLHDTLAVFGDQVFNYLQATQENEESSSKEYSDEVKLYANTFIGGQINSAKRRKTRIEILAAVLDDRVNAADPKNPSKIQRTLVWARSPDKSCARCGKAVVWKDYDCGHKTPKAFGGRAVVSNLQIEHRRCNRSAQAKQ